MLTLHGFAFSNYYNIVKHALMLKELPFREHKVFPNSPALLAVSPAGKVPALTTSDGVNLSESSVLLDYLEDAYPERPLYPADPTARAQVRQLIRISELYLELPSRRLLPAVLGNAQLSVDTKQEVLATLDRGAAAISALSSFDPYVAGATLTMADIYLRYALVIPKLAGPAQLEWNVFANIKGLADWDQMMADSDISRQVDADQKDNAPEFMAYLAERR